MPFCLRRVAASEPAILDGQIYHARRLEID